MKPELLNIIKERYPDSDNKYLASELGIPVSTLKKIASQHKIRKSPEYWQRQHQDLLRAKEEKYLTNIPAIRLSEEEQAILVGSILGDGTLSYAPRSRYAYYREHFGESQRDYREWKQKKLQRLGFKIINYNHLRGPSHPVFSDLYTAFFKDGQKTISTDNLKLFTSPLALACLFFDDGTLVITYSRNRNKIYLTPRITIYTMGFSKEENLLLAQHIAATFQVHFNLKKVPYGKGWCLDIGKISEVYRMIEMIRPFGME